MELGAQEGGYVGRDLLCETSKPVPVSVSWESTDDISLTKAVPKALLREGHQHLGTVLWWLSSLFYC